jgi:DNA-directed RNA polymerase specialized sigma24 family protein
VEAIPDILSEEQIQSIYESGPEEVIAVVRRLQSDLISLTERASRLEARVSFDNFLLHLSADRERAAERYNKLQQSLISFFAGRGSSDPESRASETIEILCRQVAEGRVFEDLEKYSIGVARNVLLKERERSSSKQVSLDDLQTDYDLRFSSPPQPSLAEKEVNEGLHQECMRSCVGDLPETDRLLITKYSGAGGHDRGTREELAKEARVSLDALRVRVHRIRSALKRCLMRCRQKGII